MAAKKTAPWDRPPPKKRAKTLTSTQKTAAKKRAQRAGRPYPNLVDNMAVAKRKGAPKKARAKKRS
jgi:hypothetical protein